MGPQEGTTKKKRRISSRRSIQETLLRRATDRLPWRVVILFALVVFDGCMLATARLFPPKTRLTWVNGIGYNTGHMEKEAPLIAQYFGGKKVEFYHNPTKMVDEQDARGYFSDLTQATQQKYLGKITAEVNGLVQHLKEAVRSVANHNGIVVHIAHSQGALVTLLAAKQLSAVEMNRIEVIAFGGATPVVSTPQTPFRRCVNYYSVNDPLLFVNPSAEAALRSGFQGSSSTIIHNNHNNDNNQNYHHPKEDEFCFLAPRVGDPIADHMLLGPTYASALEWEGRRFSRKYQSLPARTFRATMLTTLVVVSVVWQFLVAILWQKIIVRVWEARMRLRRAMVASMVAQMQAIRSWIAMVLVKLVVLLRGLFRYSNNATASVTPGEWGSGFSPPEASLLNSGSASTTSKGTTKPTTESRLLGQGSLLGLRRKITKRTPETTTATVTETEIVSNEPAPVVKSRWLPSKMKQQQQ